MEMAFQLILSFLIHHVFFRCVCFARERTSALDCVWVVQLSGISFSCVECALFATEETEKRCLQPNLEKGEKKTQKQKRERNGHGKEESQRQHRVF